MSDFLKFFDNEVKQYPMHLEIIYSKVTDYVIQVYKKGSGENCADLEIVCAQESDMELCFAKAHVQLKEFLLKERGGY